MAVRTPSPLFYLPFILRGSWGPERINNQPIKNFPREGREEETSEAEIDMEVSIAVVVGL
jgi:hypothetical protein